MTRAGHGDRVGELDITTLRERYRSGELTPLSVVDAVLHRIAERGDDAVWISRVPPDELRAAAARLDPADLDDLPLYGVPFAVKDNIDVAGLATTAACPAFEYVAAASAPLVDALVAAGAVLVGKTNLDQFATGLSGAHSPYGVPSSVHDPDLISGGSSSGSAVAVAAGLVTFAIGTDTAGSGRVPAALNGVVGLKPSIGLVSATGIVPACRSLDCASVFALSVGDAASVLELVSGFDPGDPWARPLPDPRPGPVALRGLRVGVPDRVERWGCRGEYAAWLECREQLLEAGVELVPVDLTAFLDAGRQLYDGAWVAERRHGFEDLLVARPDAVLPVIRTILDAGDLVSGVDVFGALTGMQHLRRSAYAVLESVDVLLTPTVTETFTIEEMLADPIALNARLGTFTTFTNLLDLCAVAIPAGGREDAPFGITVQAGAGRDGFVAAVAGAIEGLMADRAPAGPAPVDEGLLVAVVGAHLRGMPLHPELVLRGAELVERTTTDSSYRLFALAGTVPPKPGLRRVDAGGAEIEVEVYRMPSEQMGGFVATVAAPLAIGQVTLADGRVVHGFVCEPQGFDDAVDITAYGGWRAFREASVPG
jgi:allophanate hydrolase